MRLSKHFKLNKTQYELDFVDVDLKNDIEVFIDPWLIKDIDTDFTQECTSLLQSFFSELIKQIRNSKPEGALRLLSNLHEVNWTRLGYSKKGARGKAVAEGNAEKIHRTLKESKAVKTGLLKQLEDTALLISGIDRDIISDIVTNVVMPLLIGYTHTQTDLLGIPIDKARPLRANFWNPVKREWQLESRVFLPSYKNKPILLVPKAFVSQLPSINSDDFYKKYILAYEQQRHLNNPSLGLCRILKSGQLRAPSKKRLEREVPRTNDVIVDYVENHPELLQAFKHDLSQKIVKRRRKYKTKDELLNSRNRAGSGISLDKRVDELTQQLLDIKSGSEKAKEYHELAAGILELLFSESLTNMKIEEPIAGRTKFIDVSFLNRANSGFFLHCSKLDIPCRKIYFECKNYTEDIANEELDQLTGRFGVNTSRIGFILCRNLKNRPLFIKKCAYEIQKNRNYVLVLTDEDLLRLLKLKKERETDAIDEFLDKRLDEINGYLER